MCWCRWGWSSRAVVGPHWYKSSAESAAEVWPGDAQSAVTLPRQPTCSSVNGWAANCTSSRSVLCIPLYLGWQSCISLSQFVSGIVQTTDESSWGYWKGWALGNKQLVGFWVQCRAQLDGTWNWHEFGSMCSSGENPISKFHYDTSACVKFTDENSLCEIPWQNLSVGGRDTVADV